LKAGGGLTIERMVKLARVSRASYYRFDENGKAGADSDMDLRDAIQRVALEWPSYGRQRITRELHSRGWAVIRRLEECRAVGPETESRRGFFETIEARRHRFAERGGLGPPEPHENEPLLEARRKQIIELVEHMARERLRRS